MTDSAENVLNKLADQSKNVVDAANQSPFVNPINTNQNLNNQPTTNPNAIATQTTNTLNTNQQSANSNIPPKNISPNPLNPTS